ISRFYDREPKNRSMEYQLMEFDKKFIDGILRKSKLSTTAFFSLCAVRALHFIQSERGEEKNPIVVYIPKSLRFELKNLRAYQNLLGFIWMKFSRERLKAPDFNNHFRDFYKFRSTPNEVRKVIWAAALITKLTSYSKLRKMLYKKETKIHDSSILVSSGRTPKEIKFPEVFNTSKFYARGVMHRSPGIGLLITSNDEMDFVCVEYLKDAFDQKSISRFCEILNNEIIHYKFDS
ncbi:MAG: hypothetical protein K2Q18_15515, partial [Bdellovibrionales bacterium]|nr:hypothetical protein [Bdellovibrionales bacterium]